MTRNTKRMLTGAAGIGLILVLAVLLRLHCNQTFSTNFATAPLIIASRSYPTTKEKIAHLAAIVSYDTSLPVDDIVDNIVSEPGDLGPSTGDLKAAFKVKQNNIKLFTKGWWGEASEAYSIEPFESLHLPWKLSSKPKYYGSLNNYMIIFKTEGVILWSKRW